jgi:hypothetical protein
VQKTGRGVLVWGHIPMTIGNHEVTIHPSRGSATTVMVHNPRGYFSKRLAARAPSYTLTYGYWTSRTAVPG